MNKSLAQGLVLFCIITEYKVFRAVESAFLHCGYSVVISYLMPICFSWGYALPFFENWAQASIKQRHMYSLAKGIECIRAAKICKFCLVFFHLYCQAHVSFSNLFVKFLWFNKHHAAFDIKLRVVEIEWYCCQVTRFLANLGRFFLYTSDHCLLPRCNIQTIVPIYYYNNFPIKHQHWSLKLSCAHSTHDPTVVDNFQKLWNTRTRRFLKK